MRLGAGGYLWLSVICIPTRIILMREINEGSWRCEPLRLSTACVAEDVEGKRHFTGIDVHVASRDVRIDFIFGRSRYCDIADHADVHEKMSQNGLPSPLDNLRCPLDRQRGPVALDTSYTPARFTFGLNSCSAYTLNRF
jgi:hypothetical protein